MLNFDDPLKETISMVIFSIVLMSVMSGIYILGYKIGRESHMPLEEVVKSVEYDDIYYYTFESGRKTSRSDNDFAVGDTLRMVNIKMK